MFIYIYIHWICSWGPRHWGVFFFRVVVSLFFKGNEVTCFKVFCVKSICACACKCLVVVWYLYVLADVVHDAFERYNMRLIRIKNDNGT